MLLGNLGGAQFAQATEDDGELGRGIMLRGRQLWVKRCGPLSTQDGRTDPFSELFVVTAPLRAHTMSHEFPLTRTTPTLP